MYPKIVDGKVMAPKLLTNSHGDIIDAFVEVLPTDPDYEGLRKWLLRSNKKL